MFRVSKDKEEPGQVSLESGSGSKRESVTINSLELLSWILSATEPRSPAALKESLAIKLGVEVQAASRIIDKLLDWQVLVQPNVATSNREKGRQWEEWGWRDAFDFHYSQVGLKFDKLYDTSAYRETLEGFLADPSCGPQPGPDKYSDGSLATLSPPIPLTPERRERELIGGRTGSRETVGGALLANAPINYYTRDARVELGAIGKILNGAFGQQRVLDLILGPHMLKAYPSGGARHPLELYLGARAVEGLDPGIYHYDPAQSVLRKVNDAGSLDELDAAGYHKRGVKTSSAVLFLTTRWIRHSWKYRYSRSYRMVLIEAGHAVQTIRLTGTAYGLDVYYSPAIDDVVVSRMLRLSDDLVESPLCLLGLGTGGTI